MENKMKKTIYGLTEGDIVQVGFASMELKFGVFKVGTANYSKEIMLPDDSQVAVIGWYLSDGKQEYSLQEMLHYIGKSNNKGVLEASNDNLLIRSPKDNEIVKAPHKYWLEWKVKFNKKYREYRIQGGWLIHERQKHLMQDKSICSVPLYWVLDLIDSYDYHPMNIFRTRKHRPGGDVGSFHKTISRIIRLFYQDKDHLD